MKARKVAKKTEQRKNELFRRCIIENSENKIKWNIKDGILSRRMKKANENIFFFVQREKSMSRLNQDHNLNM